MTNSIIDYARSDAAGRRERRRQKILSNAENRLSTILSGPDGTENRQAPALDAMDTYKAAETVDIDNRESTFEFEVRGGIDYVEPVYLDKIKHNHIYATLLLGIVLRFAVAANVVAHVIPIFLTAFLGYKIAGYITTLSEHKYPKHGYAVNFLIFGGLNERFVVWIGHTLDVLWEFLTDLVITAFAYMCANIIK